MDNQNQPAFPSNAGWEHSEIKGLTKREYFAGLAMQTVLAYCLDKEIKQTFATAAKDAIDMAHELLNQLETKTEDTW